MLYNPRLGGLSGKNLSNCSFGTAAGRGLVYIHWLGHIGSSKCEVYAESDSAEQIYGSCSI
jgi:hypothetical protein